MDSEDIVNKSKKIRIYPNKNQRKLFKSWIDCQRFVYNQTIEYLNNNKKPDHWMKYSKENMKNLPDWSKIVPYQVKKIAIRDAYESRNINCRKVKNGSLKQFKLRFKSRKIPKQSCFIPKSAIKETGIYPKLSGKIRYSENIPSEFLDSRLIFHYGKWYISIPTKNKTILSENQGKVVAVDPGIRNFATFFSGESFGHIGKHDFGRIVRLCHYLDDLLSRSSKVCSRKRRSMRKAANRIREKIRNLVNELHHKTARFLVDNFDVILFPKFESSGMVCKSSRKINKKSVRSMLNYSFYRFIQFLKHKCYETGKRLILVNEAYTSRFNGFTGELMNSFSGERFKVGGKWVNRDINGARNILCFALTDMSYVRNNIANVNNS